ncbi:MAG: hypothetical protein OXN96_22210 [Bryobacterales bacterium]|nr:hypothetical protein [Bryobacterales bacterium]
MAGKTKILLAIVIVSNSIGNVVLSYGMRAVGDISSYSPASLVSSAIAAFANPWVLLGTTLLVLFFAAHTLLLTWADLSYVLLVTSCGYALVAALGAIILDESISPLRWCGIALVSCGVALVASTPASTSEGRP